MLNYKGQAKDYLGQVLREPCC